VHNNHAKAPCTYQWSKTPPTLDLVRRELHTAVNTVIAVLGDVPPSGFGTNVSTLRRNQVLRQQVLLHGVVA